MKLTKFTFFLLFLSQFLFAQKTLIEYRETKNFGSMGETKDEFLIIIPNKGTLYMENNNYNFTNEKFLTDANPNINMMITNKEDGIREYKTLFRDKKEWGWVLDNPDYTWKITKESKMILGFKCYKATTKFRGRDWTAYFSYDLPFAAGPWKLKGLPGAILEAKDGENMFTFSAIKVIQNTKIQVPGGFIDFFESYKDYKIDYDYFIKNENKLFDHMKSVTITEMPNMKITDLSHTKLRATKLEKTFEWQK